MEENGYSVLFKIVNLGKYLIYVPINLLKGSYTNDIFIDEVGTGYLYFENIDVLYNNADYCVNDITTEEQLKKMYPNSSIEQAKALFFDIYRTSVFIANPKEDDKELSVFSIDIDEIFKEVETQKDNKEVDNEPYVALTLDAIDTLLEYNYDKLKNTLENIKKHCFEENKIDENNINQEKNLDDKKDHEVKTQERLTVGKLYNYVKSRVIGQDEAIKQIIQCLVMDFYTNEPSQKNRGLIIGRTGTGKTEIFNSISKMLNIPIVKCDSTQLTMPGYVGSSLDETLIKLLYMTNGDVKKAEHSIIVFDEIDKKGSSNNYDVAGRAVLNNLLPFIDGTIYELRINNQLIQFDTSNLSIFASGAFTNVIDKVSNTKKLKPIGFIDEINKNENQTKITREHIIKYGEIPDEFAGRFSNLIKLNDHTIDSLSQILTYSKISPLLSEKEKLENINLTLEWEKEFIDEVAKKAIDLKIGARALKAIVEECIIVARWEVLSNNIGKYKTLRLLADTVENPNKYILK